MRSRYGDRHSKRRQNIVLNSLIGVVLAVILVLVANIVFTGDDSQQTASEEEQTAQTNSDEKSDSTSDDTVTSDEANSNDSENNDSEADSATDKDSTKEENDDEEKAQDKEDKEKEAQDEKDKEKEDKEKEEADQNPGEPNLDGPWEPVGTSQTGSHTSSYDIGSTDWNEKLKAVESVMGMSADEMTIWKIGGNGGPQQSYARVSKAGSGNQIYFIELEWIDGKGWKPVSVSKE